MGRLVQERREASRLHSFDFPEAATGSAVTGADRTSGFKERTGSYGPRGPEGEGDTSMDRNREGRADERVQVPVPRTEDDLGQGQSRVA